jgi:hypothetical protein
MYSTRILLLAAGVLLLLAPDSRANSFTIVPTFDSSITSDSNAAGIEATINTAIQTYETIFNNPITVNITFSELTSGLGESSFDVYEIPYSEFYTALGNENPTPQDALALKTLPSASLNPVTSTPDMLIKPANAAALGINLGLPAGSSDGTVSVNTSLTTPGSSGTSGSYSLLSVTEHEIDEVLGLGSTLGLTLPGNEDSMPSPEDLFRYDANGNRSFTTSPSAQAYFSINGSSLLAQFNNTGHGDYGDWAQSATPQVQDAFATAGANPALGTDEITALNVIGYTLATPEPATFLLVPAGLALVLWRRRCRYTGRA